MEESLSMQSKKLQKGVFRMNGVMKQTTQAALSVKGVCRTASHMAIGLVMLGCAYVGCAKENSSELLKTLEHGSGSRI